MSAMAASVVVLRADVGLPADGGVQEAVTAALMACDEGASRVLLVGSESYPYGGEARHVRMAHAGGEPWPRVIGLTDVRRGPTALPAGELIDTGIVVADAGGKFVPTDVETGRESGDMVEIRKGLAPGQIDHIYLEAEPLRDAMLAASGSGCGWGFLLKGSPRRCRCGSSDPRCLY